MRNHKYRRARALLDFRRQDEDELGFRCKFSLFLFNSSFWFLFKKNQLYK